MPNQHALVWSPEATEHFRRLYAEGTLSFGQISDELNTLGFNISRNACIGKARRMNISNGRPPGRNFGDKVKKKTTPAKARVQTNGPTPTPRPFVEPPAEKVVVRGNRSGKLIDLDANQCRYLVTGGRPPFLFCTEDKVDRSPYCARHHAVCCTPATRAH